MNAVRREACDGADLFHPKALNGVQNEGFARLARDVTQSRSDQMKHLVRRCNLLGRGDTVVSDDGLFSHGLVGLVKLQLRLVASSYVRFARGVLKMHVDVTV